MSTVKFEDLNDYCIQHILNFIPTRNLFSLQSISKRFSILIDTTFRSQTVLMVSSSRSPYEIVFDAAVCDDRSHKPCYDIHVPSSTSMIYIKKMDELPFILQRFTNLKALYLFATGITITNNWRNYQCRRDNLRYNRPLEFAESCPGLQHLHIDGIVPEEFVINLLKVLKVDHLGL